MEFRYRGRTTRRVYSFNTDQNPTGLPSITLNGEVCVPVNRDGSLARGVASAPPPDDPYSPGTTPSAWETLP